MRLGKIVSQAPFTNVDGLITYMSTRGIGQDQRRNRIGALKSTSYIKSYGYYFVDHATRMIFWAHACTCELSDEILFNVKAAKKHSYMSMWFNVARIFLEQVLSN